MSELRSSASGAGRSAVIWPAAIALAAAAVRVVYLLTVKHDPFFSFLPASPDADYFHRSALAIAGGGDWTGGRDAFFIGPLYTYFLALIYALAGPSLWVVRGVQVALDALTASLLYGTAGAWSGRPVVGRIAGLAWTFYLPAVFFSAQVAPVTLGVFLVAVALYALASGALNPARVVVAAFALSLFALDRPNVLVVVAVMTALLAVAGGRRAWWHGLVFAAVVAAVVGGVTLRNYIVSGSPVVVSSQGGMNLFIGNSAAADGVYWDLGAYGEGNPEELNRDVASAVAERALGRRLKPGEVSAWWAAQAWHWVAAHPGAAARLTIKKVLMLLNDREIPLNADFYYYKYISPFHRLPIPWFALLLAFGAAGFIGGWRAGRGASWGALFILGYGISVVAFYVSDRYRMPLTVPLTAFGAWGAEGLVTMWREKRRRSATLTTAAVLCLGAASIIPIPGHPRDDFGYTHFKYGKYYFDVGDLDRAVPHLERATASKPALYQAFILLAGAYELKGEADRGLSALGEGLKNSPDVPRMNYAYGMALINRNRPRDALPFLEKTVALDPSFEEGWQKLGMLYDYLGQTEKAAAACGRYLELNPDDAEAWLYLSGVELRRGSRERALAAARRAVAAEPRRKGANETLGRLYAAGGDFENAAVCFEREMEIAPSAALAGMLTLAYDQLGRGPDTRRAYARYIGLGGARDEEMERKIGFVWDERWRRFGMSGGNP